MKKITLLLLPILLFGQNNNTTMFNHIPLSNDNNNTYSTFYNSGADSKIYKYNAFVNTEEISSIVYVYASIDDIIFNCDSGANSNGDSCISMVQDSMDKRTYNIDTSVSALDTLSFNYYNDHYDYYTESYWLNDTCYIHSDEHVMWIGGDNDTIWE
mgnify:FL=1